MKTLILFALIALSACGGESDYGCVTEDQRYLALLDMNQAYLEGSKTRVDAAAKVYSSDACHVQP